MRIFFILKNTYPKGMASTNRVHSYGKGLINQGQKVNILLPISIEPHGCEQMNTQSEGADENGVHYKYMSGSSLRGNNILKRQINDQYGYCHTLIYLLKHLKKEDQVIVYEGGWFWQLLCIVAVHLKGAKIAMELNELPYVFGEQTKKKIAKRERMLKHVFPRYDQFIVISDALQQLAQKYAPKAKIIKVPIIVEDLLESTDKGESPIDHPYILHTGTLTQSKDGVLGLIEAFGKACQQTEIPIQYLFTGYLEKSPQREYIKKLLAKYHIEDRVKFLGYLETEELRRYQRHCDLCIINKYKTIQNKYCFSTKLGEYLAFARPVIITNVGEAMNYLKDGENAYIVEPNDTDSIANKILDILNHPDEAVTIGKAGQEVAKNVFNCDIQAQRLITFFQSA
jgi:glycosyltransferase involved in cell wall biosynthesis